MPRPRRGISASASAWEGQGPARERRQNPPGRAESAHATTANPAKRRIGLGGPGEIEH